MIIEVPTLTKRERRRLSRETDRQCRKELITGKRCQQGAVLVRVRKTIDDKGKLMRTEYCRAHSPEALLDRLGVSRFGGKTSTSGLNKGKFRTNPHKVMRELVEEHIAEFLAPYIKALSAEKEVVVGHGRSAHVVSVPDHRARMQAAESLFDRVYGKPKQSTVLEGGITVEPVEVPQDDQRQLEVAKILAAAGAVGPVGAAEQTIKRASKAGQN